MSQKLNELKKLQLSQFEITEELEASLIEVTKKAYIAALLEHSDLTRAQAERAWLSYAATDLEE